MGLVNTGIKSTPCVQWNIRLFFYVVGLYLYWRPWTSCLDTWHHGLYQIPTDKKKIGAMFGSSNRKIIQIKPKKQHKNGSQNQASAMAIPVLWPEPVENEWGEEKRRSTVMELGIWRIWSDSGWRNGLWSLVRCSLTSSGIIGENVELLNWQIEVSKSIE